MAKRYDTPYPLRVEVAPWAHGASARRIARVALKCPPSKMECLLKALIKGKEEERGRKCR